MSLLHLNLRRFWLEYDTFRNQWEALVFTDTHVFKAWGSTPSKAIVELKKMIQVGQHLAVKTPETVTGIKGNGYAYVGGPRPKLEDFF